MSTLFVSDVHLNDSRPGMVHAFVEFLGSAAREADALFILGDLFDLWLGDDDDRSPHPRICDALARLTASGLPVSVVHGNHDFLLGRQFAARTGCALLGDHTVVDVYGTPVLVMHGDTLCTRDRRYQNYRKVVRNRLVQKLFLSMSFDWRMRKAAGIRSETKKDVALKSDDIMDVTEAAVAEAMRRYRVRHLVHGHTHRPAVHDFELDGQPATRIVLGDWYEQDSVLAWDESGYRLGRVEDL
ncbi:MAG: UDP-2,3-diacylglucosamine diphosphatase [Gammaproteobacteria bacterium]|nr:UDP-2,3-diacylglucosamine diphosphatase [Gammaproteobacteria bacterium]